MTVREAIDKVDGLKANQYTDEEKLTWLSQVDASIYNDIILSHEGFEEVHFAPYTKDDFNKVLIAEFPYDELYVSFLKMKIDDENMETQKYNNSAAIFNAYLQDYAKWYQKNHLPINKNTFRIWG